MKKKKSLKRNKQFPKILFENDVLCFIYLNKFSCEFQIGWVTLNLVWILTNRGRNMELPSLHKHPKSENVHRSKLI